MHVAICTSFHGAEKMLENSNRATQCLFGYTVGAFLLGTIDCYNLYQFIYFKKKYKSNYCLQEKMKKIVAL